MGSVLKQERILAAIERAPSGRKEYLIGRLEELKKLSNLEASLKHHIHEMEEKRKEIEVVATVKVTGNTYPRVTVQIGGLSKILQEEIPGVSFRLNDEQDAISQGPLG